VVTRIEWAYPHVYIHVQTENNVGKPVVWVIEGQSPRIMSLFGWSQGSLAAGDRVTVAANPTRNQNRTMALGRSVLKQDGTVLQISWQADVIRDALRAQRPGQNRR
jgi:hypothetical protein